MGLWGENTWSTNELSEALGISAQRIGALVKEGVIPRPTNGSHDVKAAVRAYCQLLRKRLEDKSKDGAEIQKLELENAIRKIKLQRITGELIPLEQVKADWYKAARRVRDALQNLPSRLSGPFAAETKQERIFESFTNEIHRVLSELAGEDHDQTERQATASNGEEENGQSETAAVLSRSSDGGLFGFCDQNDAVGDWEGSAADQEDSAASD